MQGYREAYIQRTQRDIEANTQNSIQAYLLHTYIRTHTFINTSIRACIDTHIHSSIYTITHHNKHTYNARYREITERQIYMGIQGYIYTYVERATHPNLHTHIHTYINIYRQTYIHTYIHTYIRTYRHAYIHTYIPTCLHTYIHTIIHTPMHMYTENT